MEKQYERKTHYYAKYDTFQDHNRDNAGWGFANTKRAIAFNSKKQRDDFVKKQSDFDYSCEAITREVALQMLELCPMSNDKGVLLVLADGNFDFLILRASKY